FDGFSRGGFGVKNVNLPNTTASQVRDCNDKDRSSATSLKNLAISVNVYEKMSII
ncbi:hypothetical protein K0M31_007170, partial [Melipona bicolor]